MADNWTQRRKFMELLGEGPARLAHLVVVSALALSGIALQGLVWWYAARVASEEWNNVGLQVWTCAVGIWIVTLGLLLALLWKRRKDMREGAAIEV